MSLIATVIETAEHTESISPFIPAGIAFVVLLALGVVTWSYRDVANRHSHKTGDHDAHTAGH
ncbi:hypothetical protein EYE40_06270 [Glaciihabitans arcticus]|uniref:4-hydroxybenzoate polyprenyltransferase n=1 Tax=Glaciihabitans arcticus TaxID=2668039 RepID=A0A4Q9GQA5_9MICO|nr:hypothetical protein [Glaciihabitans arcticus]TBN57036.1 hypothetical protein EYE40_06270 [Glaciihabitans arcticus]